MKILKTENITTNCFGAAEEENLFLEVGVKCIYEVFSYEDDGIFSNVGIWKKFIRKVDGEGVEFLIRNRYINKKIDKNIKFAVKIGKDKYAEVNKKDLNINFDYEFYWSRKQDFSEAGILEIYMTASIL